MSKKHVFVPLDQERRNTLDQAGVPVVDFSIDEPGVLVEEMHMKNLLDVLSATVVAENRTQYEGITQVLIAIQNSGGTTRTAGNNKIVAANWDGKNCDAFLKAAEALLPTLNREKVSDIIMHVPHGYPRTPSEDGNFHIMIWSSPSGQRQRVVPQRMWGYTVDCRDQGFAPSGRGIPIVEDEGWEVAELVDRRNLYIHHDICEAGSDNELEIFKKILEEVVALLTLSEKERSERQAKTRDAQVNQARDEYVRQAALSIKTRVDGVQRELEDAKRKLEAAQKSLAECVRNVKTQEEELEVLIAGRAQQEQQLAHEYDRLLAAPSIKEVRVAKGVLTVLTDTLYCVDPRTNKRHEIGKFRIELNLDGREDCVRWFNQTRRVNTPSKAGMHAPHVGPEGVGCLGNTKGMFPRLIASYDFTSAINLAIQFVESVNVNDNWGKHIELWPVA